MHLHSIFGGTLASELHFPELDAAVGPATWSFRVDDGSSPRADELLGQEQLPGEVSVRLLRADDRLSLEYDDTGRFDILDGGREIVWRRRADVPLDAVRTDVISRVMAAALHASGRLCLHGSAVEIDDRAILFLAPKLHGKSTLAVALAQGGARLLSDDAVLVEPGDEPMAWPGVHSVRLWNDSAVRLGTVATEAAAAGGKHLLRHLPPARLRTTPAPIAAIYLLTPAPDDQRAAVTREPVSPRLAAMGVLGHAKLGALLDGPAGAAAFERAASLAARVPLSVLRVVRDFERLDETVATILGWHRAPPVA